LKTFNAAYASHNFSEAVEARYVFRLVFSDDTADDVYIRSHDDVTIPGVTVLDAKLSTISVISQTLNLESGTSQIGNMRFSALDTAGSLTDHQRTQINANHSARWRPVEMFKGFRGLDWGSYEKQASQILNEVSFRGGEYTFTCRDILRSVRKEILDPIKLVLSAEVGETDTTVQIVSSTDQLGRTLRGYLHDNGFTDRPLEKVAYLKIDDEIISVAHSDITATALNNVRRGALGTRADKHTASSDGKDIDEVVYLEGAWPRVAYSLLTGFWLGQDLAEPLPDHWNAGVPGEFVNTSEFL